MMDNDELFEKSRSAIIKRLAAENTWLRHNYMEMEERIADLKKQLSELESQAGKVSAKFQGQNASLAKARAAQTRSAESQTPEKLFE